MVRLIPKTVVLLFAFLVSTTLLHAQAPPVNATLLGQWDGYGGTYADVWVEGSYAYIGTFGGNVVYIIDITNPATPTVAGQVFGTGSLQDVKVHNGLMFVPGGDVLIIDVRDPANPVTLVNINLSGIGNAHNTFYEDGYLYIVDSGSTSVGIVDLTAFDPDNPPQGTITQAKWILTNVGSSMVHDITVRDGRLYACAWDSGLWIYDVTDVANTPPSFLVSAPGNNTHSCWPSPDGRFVVTGEERSGGGIKVFKFNDTTIPLTLTLTDSLALPVGEASSVHNQFVIGYRVYNSWYGAGLQVHDIDPVTGMLSFVASYDTPGDWGVYPANSDALILVSDMQSGLLLIEIDEGSINNDCNINGIDDAVDLANGTSTDCNGNGIPDECEPVLDQDCNNNGVLDACDTDCNANGIPDACEYPGCPGILPADMNCDGDRNGVDIQEFVDILAAGEYMCQADMNQDGASDMADASLFVSALLGP